MENNEGPKHTTVEFKGCLIEIYDFIQILKAHYVSKQCIA